jgi:hypothetical protein
VNKRQQTQKANEQVPVQPDPDDQSGSTGRPTTGDKGRQGQDTGQDRYGQTGLGGTQEHETEGQARYRRSGVEGDDSERTGSTPGSGSSKQPAENEVRQKKP